MRKCAFTLLELLIVLIVVGILATIGFVNYSGVKEEALDKEAKISLRLIMAAEQIYRMDTGNYYESENKRPPTQPQSTINLNNNLKLSLPTSENRTWEYATYPDMCVVSSFCVEAQRHGGNGRLWYLLPLMEDEDPRSGRCPC